MLIYLFGFFLSITIFASIQKQPNRSYTFIIGSIIAILIPCLIAGFRSPAVGTDTAGYPLGLYNSALQSDSLSTYFAQRFTVFGWDIKTPKSYEPGFSLLIFFVTRIFRSYAAVLFTIQLMTIVPIYVALLMLKDRLSIWQGMSIYYFLFFNSSLNTMRQWIAMAFLLLAFSYLLLNRQVRSILFVTFSCLFHFTAVIGFLIIVLYHYSIGGSWGQTAKVILLFISGIAFLFGIQLFSNLLSRIGLSNYAGYLSGEVRLMPNQLILRAPLVVLFGLCWKQFLASNKAAPFFLAMMLLDVASSQLLSLELSNVGGSMNSRITMYFSEYLIISLPLIYQSIRDKRLKVIFILAVFAYLIIFWIYTFAYAGYNSTIPYEFTSEFSSFLIGA